MFYYRVREAIEKSGKTYRQIAEEAGVDLSTLARVASAKTSRDYNLTLRTLDGLCRVLNCKPDELVKRK